MRKGMSMRVRWVLGMICAFSAHGLTLSVALWAFLIGDLERLPRTSRSPSNAGPA